MEGLHLGRIRDAANRAATILQGGGVEPISTPDQFAGDAGFTHNMNGDLDVPREEGEKVQVDIRLEELSRAREALSIQATFAEFNMNGDSIH